MIFFLTYAGINTGLFATHFFIQFPFLWRITMFPQMLMPPAAFFYVRSIINQEVRFKKTDFLALLPILFYTVNFYPVYSMPLPEKIKLIETMLSNKSLLSLEIDGLLPNKIGLSLRMIYSLAFAIAQSIMLYRWNANMKKQENIVSQNIEMLKWLNFFTWMVNLIFILLVAATFWQNQTNLNVFLVMAAIILSGAIALCTYLLSKPKILYGLKGWLQLNEINNTLILLQTDKERFQQKIKTYFKNNNSFVDPDFKLTDLANRIGESPGLTTAFINQEYGKGFNHFINDMRIGYMNNQMLNNPLWKSYSHEARAKMAGFKSRDLIPTLFRNGILIDKILVCLEVEVSFSTRFQVWYRNSRNKPSIKQVKGRNFSICVKKVKRDSRIELLALVSNPKQLDNQHVTLSISIENREIQKICLPIQRDENYPEWHKISFDYFVDEKINIFTA